MSEENIRVIGRFRPLNERELNLEPKNAPPPRFGEGGRTVWVGPDEGSAHTYALDAMLPPEATQSDVYEHASGLVDRFLQGYNATLLAYGQTGSGKTHSVMGQLNNEAELGLLPRAVRQVFDSIVNDTTGASFAVSCSYLEIYKEAVRDLLAPPPPPPSARLGEGESRAVNPTLPIREAVGKGVYVEGLTEVPVMGEADVLDCVSCGNASRMVGSTLMNNQSSRSHALLMITLQQQMPDGSTKVSRLNIADLAGSEKVSKTGSSGETLEEAKKINASLSALCLVIAALSDNKPHIPYRNSKLTRILQESLGGNSKTMMLVACSPAANNAAETHSTLKFATRAKKVKNAAVVNRVLTADQLENANAALKLELKAARERIANLENSGGNGGGGGDAPPPPPPPETTEELENLRAQLAEMEMAVEEAKEEAKDEQKELVAARDKLARRNEEREMLYDTLARFQVLSGVAPLERRERVDNANPMDKLRRQLVDLEGEALRKEMSIDDDTAAGGGGEILRLKAQIADQHRRIRELEPLAEAGAEATAAQQEVAHLKEQLQQLASNRLQQVTKGAGRAGVRMSMMPGTPSGRQGNLNLCTGLAGAGAGMAAESFRQKEAFGQHMLRGKDNKEPQTPTPHTPSAKTPNAEGGATPQSVAAAAAQAAARAASPTRVACRAL